MPSFFNGYSTDFGISIGDFYDNDNFKNILHRRMTDPVFTKRQLVYWPTFHLGNILGLPFQFIYNLINISSLAVIVLMIKKIGTHYNKSTILSTAFLFIYFPFIFCTCSMMAGFDEYLHWALSLTTFYLFIRKQVFVASLFLFLSIVCRETTLLVLPIFFYLLEKRTSRYTMFGIAIALGLYIQLTAGVDNTASADYFFTKRFQQLSYNFGSFDSIVVSIWSIFIGVFVPIKLTKIEDTKLKNVVFICTMVTLLIAVITIYIDEVRAIFYPLIFTVPFWGEKVEEYILTFKKSVLNQWKYIPFYLIGLYFIAFILYKPCVSKSCVVYNVYAFTFLIVTFLITMQYYVFNNKNYKYIQ